MYRKKKTSFFKQLKIALFKPTEFTDLLSLNMGKSIGYLFVFSLILSILISSFIYFQIMVKDGGIPIAMDQILPEFLISNGELQLEQEYSINTSDLYLFANDEINQFTMSDLEYVMGQGEYGQVLLISKTNLIMNRNGRIQNMIFAEQLTSPLNKETAINFLVTIFVVLTAIILILSCPTFFVLQLLAACIIFVLAAIMNAVLSKEATGKQLYQMSLYITGNLTIVSMLINFIPFHITGKIKLLIGAVISIIYLIFALSAANVIVSREKNLRSTGYYNQNYAYNGNNSLDLSDEAFSQKTIE